MHCKNCGTRIPNNAILCTNCKIKQTNNEKIKRLQISAKNTRKIMNGTKIFSIICIILFILIFYICTTRSVPDNMPDLSRLPVPQSIFTDHYRYADTNVQKFWDEGRKLITYMFTCILLFVASFITYIIQKRNYKKIMKTIKTEKNKLQDT